MRYQEFFFSTLCFGATTDGEWHLILCGVQTAEWEGALLYLGGSNFRLNRIDLFWLHDHVVRFIDNWRHM